VHEVRRSAGAQDPVLPHASHVPLRKHVGVDHVARFFDDLLWASRTLKAARASG
jgi:hypothetical protein